MDQEAALTEAERPTPVPMPAMPRAGSLDGPASASRVASTAALAAGPATGLAIGSELAIVDPAEHNVVFTSLVTGDGDIVGLVAYSIYKQNKYDWLDAYSRLEGRMPEPAEVHSYLLGESTPRRLATYRQLAQAVLDGQSPAAPAAVPGSVTIASPPARATAAAAVPPPRIGVARGRSNFQLSARAIVALCVALIALVALFWLMRSGAPLPPQTPAK